MTTSELVQIILMGLLVVITGIYAWRTFAISNASKKQAKTGMRMAKEMREQRFEEARPYLLLRLTNEWVQWPPSGNEFSVTIRNEGKGPAVNVEASLWHPKTIHPCHTKGYLAYGEEWQEAISTSDVGVPYEGEEEVRPWLPELRDIIKPGNAGAVVVLYHDIHKRKWLTYLALEWHGDVPYVRDGEQNIMEWKNHD